MIFELKKYDSYILDKINELNVKKIFNLSIIALPIHILHTIYFYFSKSSNSESIIFWKNNIIVSHFIASIFVLIFIFVSSYIKEKKLFSSNLSKLLPYLVCIFYILFGIYIVTVDQIITSAITPFLIICALLSILLLIKPINSFIFFLSSYALFYNLIETYQSNYNILLSNRANGISSVSVGFLLSYILWKETVKNLEQKRIIENQKKELIIANETKDKFFSIIAHDLKGPIGALVKMFDLLENKNIDPVDRNEIQLEMKKSAKSTYDLLENLLRWSRLQSNNIDFYPEKVNCYDLVDKNFKLLKNSAKSKEITLINNVDKEHIIFADKDMITTVIRNLLSNAIKFTNNDGLVEINSEKKDKFIFISVKDNGVGMNNEDINRLFKASEKVVNFGTNGEKGTGLGLLLCNEFIKKNNGEIFVKSEIGKGSTFTFKIPYN